MFAYRVTIYVCVALAALTAYGLAPLFLAVCQLC